MDSLTYKVEEMEIGDDMADVVFEVEYSVRGRHYVATWYEPEENPEIDIENVTIDEIAVTDHEGNPIEATDAHRAYALSRLDLEAVDEACFARYTDLAWSD